MMARRARSDQNPQFGDRPGSKLNGARIREAQLSDDSIRRWID